MASKKKAVFYFLISMAIFVGLIEFFISTGGFAKHEHRSVVLPNFSGPIMDQGEIVWGSETYEMVPFCQTEDWNSGFMTFGTCEYGIVLRAQRPSPTIPGLHQRAEKKIDVLAGNLFREVRDVERRGNNLVPISSPWLPLALIILVMPGFVLCMLACFCISKLVH